MENSERNVYDILESDENILWQGGPDVKKGVVTEYVKVFVLALAIVIVGGISSSLATKLFANNQFMAIVPIIISFLVLVYALIKHVRLAITSKTRYSMEKYVITDRQILVKNMENPEWLKISYHKVRRLDTYEMAMDFSMSVRTINIILENREQEIIYMNHIDNWCDVCKMICSQKYGIPTEEVDINDDFFHHMEKDNDGRGYHRVYFWA